MKKVVLALAVVALVAASASATIVNTPHDLSTTGTWAGKSTNASESCVFCHTPHRAIDPATIDAPLWNQSVSGVTAISSAYNSALGTQQGNPTTTSVDATDVFMCLSCHDGGTLNDLQNPPNALGGSQPTMGNTTITNTDRVFNGQFNDDHPIGFVWDSALSAADKELVDPADATFAAAMGGAGSFLFGASSNEFWCSTCHDVHNNSEGAFLRINNANSAFCLACHNAK